MPSNESGASAEQLAAERDHCLGAIAEALRDGAAAACALDIDELARCTELQARYADQLSALLKKSQSAPVLTPADIHSARALGRALRTYAALLRRSSECLDSRRHTLALLASSSFDETNRCACRA